MREPGTNRPRLPLFFKEEAMLQNISPNGKLQIVKFTGFSLSYESPWGNQEFRVKTIDTQKTLLNYGLKQWYLRVQGKL
jgi:hypothetical protein